MSQTPNRLGELVAQAERQLALLDRLDERRAETGVDYGPEVEERLEGARFRAARARAKAQRRMVGQRDVDFNNVPGTLENVGTSLKGVATLPGDMVGSLLQQGAIQGKNIERSTGMLGLGEDFVPEESMQHKVGTWLKEKPREWLGVDESAEKSTLFQLPRLPAQVAGGIVAGVAGGPPGLAVYSALGGATEAQSFYEESFAKSKARGLSDDQAREVAEDGARNIGLFASVLEAVSGRIGTGLFKAASKAPGVSTALQKAVGVPGVATATEMATEAAEEAAVQALVNREARSTFDPERPLTEGVPEAAALGAFGGFVGGAGIEAGRFIDRQRGPSTPSSTPTPPPLPEAEHHEAARVDAAGAEMQKRSRAQHEAIAKEEVEALPVNSLEGRLAEAKQAREESLAKDDHNSAIYHDAVIHEATRRLEAVQAEAQAVAQEEAEVEAEALAEAEAVATEDAAVEDVAEEVISEKQAEIQEAAVKESRKLKGKKRQDVIEWFESVGDDPQMLPVAQAMLDMPARFGKTWRQELGDAVALQSTQEAELARVAEEAEQIPIGEMVRVVQNPDGELTKRVGKPGKLISREGGVSVIEYESGERVPVGPVYEKAPPPDVEGAPQASTTTSSPTETPSKSPASQPTTAAERPSKPAGEAPAPDGATPAVTSPAASQETGVATTATSGDTSLSEESGEGSPTTQPNHLPQEAQPSPAVPTMTGAQLKSESLKENEADVVEWTQEVANAEAALATARGDEANAGTEQVRREALDAVAEAEDVLRISKSALAAAQRETQEDSERTDADWDALAKEQNDSIAFLNGLDQLLSRLLPGEAVTVGGNPLGFIYQQLGIPRPGPNDGRRETLSRAGSALAFGAVVDPRRITSKEVQKGLAIALHRQEAEAQGLDPDAIMGPSSGLTDAGKRALAQKHADRAKQVLREVANYVDTAPSAQTEQVDPTERSKAVSEATAELQAQAPLLTNERLGELRAELARITGKDPSQILFPETVESLAGQPRLGRYIRGLVEVALRQDPVSARDTSLHESWHAIVAEFLTPQEAAFMEQALGDEEAQAETFASTHAGKGVPGKLGSLFQKLDGFLRKLGNFLRGKGFHSVNDLFGRAFRGDLAESRTAKLDAELPTVEPGLEARINMGHTLGDRDVRVLEVVERDNGKSSVRYEYRKDDGAWRQESRSLDGFTKRMKVAGLPASAPSAARFGTVDIRSLYDQALEGPPTEAEGPLTFNPEEFVTTGGVPFLVSRGWAVSRYGHDGQRLAAVAHTLEAWREALKSQLALDIRDANRFAKERQGRRFRGGITRQQEAHFGAVVEGIDLAAYAADERAKADETAHPETKAGFLEEVEWAEKALKGLGGNPADLMETLTREEAAQELADAEDHLLGAEGGEQTYLQNRVDYLAHMLEAFDGETLTVFKTLEAAGDHPLAHTIPAALAYRTFHDKLLAQAQRVMGDATAPPLPNHFPHLMSPKLRGEFLKGNKADEKHRLVVRRIAETLTESGMGSQEAMDQADAMLSGLYTRPPSLVAAQEHRSLQRRRSGLIPLSLVDWHLDSTQRYAWETANTIVEWQAFGDVSQDGTVLRTPTQGLHEVMAAIHQATGAQEANEAANFWDQHLRREKLDGQEAAAHRVGALASDLQYTARLAASPFQTLEQLLQVVHATTRYGLFNTLEAAASLRNQSARDEALRSGIIDTGGGLHIWAGGSGVQADPLKSDLDVSRGMQWLDLFKEWGLKPTFGSMDRIARMVAFHAASSRALENVRIIQRGESNGLLQKLKVRRTPQVAREELAEHFRWSDEQINRAVSEGVMPADLRAYTGYSSVARTQRAGGAFNTAAILNKRGYATFLRVFTNFKYGQAREFLTETIGPALGKHGHQKFTSGGHKRSMYLAPLLRALMVIPAGGLLRAWLMEVIRGRDRDTDHREYEQHYEWLFQRAWEDMAALGYTYGIERFPDLMSREALTIPFGTANVEMVGGALDAAGRAAAKAHEDPSHSHEHALDEAAKLLEGQFTAIRDWRRLVRRTKYDSKNHERVRAATWQFVLQKRKNLVDEVRDEQSDFAKSPYSRQRERLSRAVIEGRTEDARKAAEEYLADYLAINASKDPAPTRAKALRHVEGAAMTQSPMGTLVKGMNLSARTASANLRALKEHMEGSRSDLTYEQALELQKTYIAGLKAALAGL